MKELNPEEIAACDAIAIASYIFAVVVFFKICKEVDSVPGAPSIKDWTTARPYHPFAVFRAHRASFPLSWLTSTYWLLAIACVAAFGTLSFHHAVPIWLNLLLLSIGAATFGRLAVKNEFAKR